MLSLEDKAMAAKMVKEILKGDILRNDIDNAMRLNHKNLSNERLGSALKTALEDPDTLEFDAAVSTAAAMLRGGDRLPDWLAVFAADVLQGKRTRPTKRGPDPYANWTRDYAVARAVLDVSSRFDLPQYTKNELSNKVTAAQIVSETAHLSLDVVHKAIQKFGGQISRVTSPQVTKD
jgi:hypothetical protein